METAALAGATKSVAPGQYLGYGLQAVRLCHHLLHAESAASVSLEFVDDVAVHKADGTLLLEQTKSALSGNPLADSSVELWKAFSNWGQLASTKQIDPTKTTFRIYVCPTKQGNLAQVLHDAKSDESAKAALSKIEKKITPTNKDKGCNPKISEFLAAGPETCAQIIRNFEIVVEDDPLESIRAPIRLAVPDEALDVFCAAAIGDAKNQIDSLIRAKLIPVIGAQSFRDRFRAFVRKHSLLGLLNSATSAPSDNDVQSVLGAMPMFVRQLAAIGTSDDLVLRAVSDFLRTDADRTAWAADGIIVEDSFDELHDALERHFAITRDEVEDMSATQTPELRGRQIYRRCVAHQVPLEGRPLPTHFIPGSYNGLANIIRIGWHPNFQNMFGS